MVEGKMQAILAFYKPCQEWKKCADACRSVNGRQPGIFNRG
jgi:hypothetical protein